MCQPLTAEGEFALVREYLETALGQPSIGWVAFGDHEVLNLLVDVAAQQGDITALQRFIPPAEELASRLGHRLNQAVAHRAWGVLYRLTGQYAESKIRFEQALEIFQQMNTPWQIGRTLFELGELSIPLADISSARDYFTRALSAFETLSALPDAARTRQKLELT
jgi:tetratricopeptide (TPR) repeat protein